MSIIPYTFPETATAVRVVTIGDEPWFVAADVADILGYRMASDMTRRLDDDEKGTRPVRTPGGTQKLAIISEPGLYSAVLASRVPQAKAFKRWMTHEVIPSIRRTGSYSAPVAPALPSPRELAALVIAEADRADAAEARVMELEPKALAHDTYLSVGSGDRLVREVAKLLGWRQQDLRQFLIAERLIFARVADCGSTQWDFYAGHERHFRSAETVVTHRTRGLCSHYTLYVRPAGVDLIQRRIAKRQAERDAIGGAA
ncbi:phage antirepressor [Streptomyces kaniharaensis]|uniref:phage antirepressor n=1 Tax=Streptomyces kaniharaensis TaxID=212423 RepID=UPI002DDCCF93|nr:BRO family protein [Streptomyces kaniharaensis]